LTVVGYTLSPSMTSLAALNEDDILPSKIDTVKYPELSESWTSEKFNNTDYLLIVLRIDC